MVYVMRLTKHVNELKKSLMLPRDTVYYVDVSLVPAFLKNKHNLLKAWCAYKNFIIMPVTVMPETCSIIAQSVSYPLRDKTMPFEVYEIAVVLIRDGMSIKDALNAAPSLV